MSNSDDVLIKVEHVSKKFCRSLKRPMLYGIAFVGCGEGRTASFATDAHRYRSAHPTHFFSWFPRSSVGIHTSLHSHGGPWERGMLLPSCR